VNNLATDGASTANISLLRNGREIGALRTTEAGLTLSAEQLAFFDSTPVTRPFVTGSRGDNPALASVLSALVKLGLVIDQTRA
jgi:hypothetical protein